MTTLLVIIWVILVIGLLFAMGVHPERTHHSWFELGRLGDKAAQRRERLLGDMVALWRVIAGLLLLAVTLLGMSLWQTWGVVASIGVWLVGGAIVRGKPVHELIARGYAVVEPRLLDSIEKIPIIGWLFRTKNWRPRDSRLESPEQLLHLVEASGHVLAPDQQEIIRRGLDWHTMAVKAVMTGRNDIVTIKHSELLGPLVLDDLHHSGHNRFPVIRGNLDTIIGVLDITELLEIDAGKKSQTAEKAMLPQALRIESDEPLPAALTMLQKSHQHLLVVVDEDGKTVGLVTLADITSSLLGKK